MGHTVAPQQDNSSSVVCSLTRVSVCVREFIYAMQVQTRSDLHVRVCVYLWCVWVCACMCVCVFSVGPWSLSVDLNQPSPVMFAQDMPQEAKTTVRVCPCCEPLLIHPTAAFFHSAQTLCLSVFLYIHPMESVGPFSPWGDAHRWSGAGGIEMPANLRGKIPFPPRASYIIQKRYNLYLDQPSVPHSAQLTFRTSER